MGDINKTGDDSVTPRWISVEKIESLSSLSKANDDVNHSSSKKMGGLLAYIKKFIDSIDEDGEAKLNKTIIHKSIYSDLIRLKKILTKLKTSDHSEDLSFLREFGEFWKKHVIEKHLFNNELLPAIEKLFLDIHNYTHDTDQPLGYYLVERLDTDWTPRPFINLIHYLHENHVDSPSHSLLTEWTTQIDEITAKIVK